MHIICRIYILLMKQYSSHMEKYLVTIEFRYSDFDNKISSTCRSRKITIGVFDSFDLACENGNACLECLESRFEIHSFPNGSKAAKERFSKNGGPFGSKNDLVTNLAYLKTPFDFYAKIQTLKYDALETAVDDVLSALVRFKNHKAEVSDED